MNTAPTLMMERNDAEAVIALVGCDVTRSLSLRMLGTSEQGQEQRSLESKKQRECNASLRLLPSLRNEAIWRYHVSRSRGFLLWTLQLSVYYVQAQHMKFLRALSTRLYDRTAKLLTDYSPRSQAIVVSEHERIWDVFRLAGDEITSRSVICRDHLFDLTEPLASALVSTSH